LNEFTPTTQLISLNTLPNPHLYFAYGSNLDPEQMQWRCPDALAISAASLDDWAWRIGGRGYATVSPSPGHHVWGAIWNVSDSDLARLDRYEGVAGGLYRREPILVLANDQFVETHIYIENYDDHGVPRPDYLEGIIAGARWFDLPQAWIDELTATKV
jgi:gamma-glutamylcyclotransferase (GGCT)/AIG2-like uncharacterized protein YtfP